MNWKPSPNFSWPSTHSSNKKTKKHRHLDPPSKSQGKLTPSLEEERKQQREKRTMEYIPAKKPKSSVGNRAVTNTEREADDLCSPRDKKDSSGDISKGVCF